jgi:DNA-binding ferritin-like protein
LSKSRSSRALERARPLDHQQAREIQALARTMARQAAEAGDDGTNDLVVSDVIRTNEKQVWFVSEHVVDVPLVRAD